MKEEVISHEAEFSDQQYRRWAGELSINRRMFDKYESPRQEWDWRQQSAMLLGNVAGKSLLDFGCGMGEEAVYFAKLGANVTAIDISPIGIKMTRDRAKANGVESQVTAELMDCSSTSFPDEFFDVAHGLGILHHVGLHEGLAEVRRILKPSGRAVFLEWMGDSDAVDKIKKFLYGKEYASHQSEHEEPLKWSGIQQEAHYFSVFKTYPYHLSYRLRSLFPALCRGGWSERADHLLLGLCPPLRHFAGGAVIYLEK